jgi:ribosomal protein S18 acetylase RimI-like enzyme
MWQEMTADHSLMSPIFAPTDRAEDSFAVHLGILMTKANYYMPVAEIDGEIAGYVIASCYDLPDVFALRRKVSLQDMMVKKSFRRKGVGRRLVEAVRDFATAQKADRIDLQVAVKNEAGFEFWKAVGFEPTMYNMTIIRP